MKSMAVGVNDFLCFQFCFVLIVQILRERLLPWHHVAKSLTASPQSCVYMAYRSGLSTQP